MPRKPATSQHAGAARSDATSDDAAPGRPFWSGLLSFGLVSIPVDLLSAHRSNAASLRQLDADGTPLARRYHCPKDDVDVDSEHLVHGYELPDGSFVAITDRELEALAPKKSREIDLRLFVDRDSLDPLYFERSYFLAPGSDSGKAYRLLSAVMERKRRAGIATFVMRDREYLVAIFSEDGLLRAETLRFAGEVRSPKTIGLGQPVKPSPARLRAVEAAVSSLSKEEFVTKGLVDEHSRALRELAEKKQGKGEDIVVAPSGAAGEGEGAEIIDLMQVLQQSLARSGLVSPSASEPSATKASANTASRAAAPRSNDKRRKLKKRATPSASKGGKSTKESGKARPAREPGRRVKTAARTRRATGRPRERH